jgi:membrane protease YdiL (CAAX protease family)
MLDFADHALAVILVAVIPPRAWFSYRALRRSAPERRAALRRRIYLAAIITQWALCAALIGHWALGGRPWAALGLIPVLTPGAIGVGAGLALMVVMIARQATGAVSGGVLLERARTRLAHVEALMPHDAGELALFRAVAVTAGVCEELLFRGFLIWYAAHFTGLIQASLAVAASFGIGHLYQGPRQAAVTALIGAFLGGVYLISGSLALPMLIHALMDLYSGWLGYRAFAPPAATGAPPAARAG